MELFFNLVWVAVSAALVGVWLCRRPGAVCRRPRLAAALQAAALVALIAILLPVISLNDDMRVKVLAPESEHATLRNDSRTIADHALPAFSAALPALAVETILADPPAQADILAPEGATGVLAAGYPRLPGSRSPPAV